jgi:carbohydrate kinase (thermoresistant glucokinase family)
MAAGQPLSEQERGPWLRAIRAWIDERVSQQEPGVVSCSALKRAYRDALRVPQVQFVYLRGGHAQIAERLATRVGHFFKPQLLDSQFELLEEPDVDEQVITVSIDASPSEIVAEIRALAGLS